MQTTLGEYVKVPGLQPDETNAIIYLTDEQLSKLAARVAEAQDRLQRRVARLIKLSPGTLVYATVSDRGIPHGAKGVIVDRALLVAPPPSDHVAVAFIGQPNIVSYSVFHLASWVWAER